jgi:LysM repeat protein
LTGRWGREHRLPAHVTGESDWEVEVPQIRMSRAFAVMLVLHIVAVGGLFAFRIWGRDKEEKTTQVSGADAGPALVESPAADASTPIPLEQGTPSEPLRTYLWRSGDTLPLVAARFGISGSALRDANPDKTFEAGTELIIPRAGRVIGGPESENPVGHASEIFDPSKVETGTRPPRAVIVPEISQSEIPDAMPSPANEVTPPVARAVTATGRPKSDGTRLVTAANPKKKPAVEESTPARTAGQRTHVVAKGDTVFNVAKRYGFTPEEIAQANGLDSSFHIRMGQQLRIPVRR